jgi:hypothetical protein
MMAGDAPVMAGAGRPSTTFCCEFEIVDGRPGPGGRWAAYVNHFGWHFGGWHFGGW